MIKTAMWQRRSAFASVRTLRSITVISVALIFVMINTQASAQLANLPTLIERYCKSLSKGNLDPFFRYQYDYRRDLGRRLERYPSVLHEEKEEELKEEHRSRLKKTIGQISLPNLYDYVYEPNATVEYQILEVASDGLSVFVKIKYSDPTDAPWHPRDDRRVSEVILRVYNHQGAARPGQNRFPRTIDSRSEIVPDTLKLFPVPDIFSSGDPYGAVERTLADRPSRLTLRPVSWWKPVSKSENILNEIRDAFDAAGLKFKGFRRKTKRGAFQDVYTDAQFPETWGDPGLRQTIKFGPPGSDSSPEYYRTFRIGTDRATNLDILWVGPQLERHGRWKQTIVWRLQRKQTPLGELIASLSDEARSIFLKHIADKLFAKHHDALASIGVENEPSVYRITAYFEGSDGWVMRPGYRRTILDIANSELKAENWSIAESWYKIAIQEGSIKALERLARLYCGSNAPHLRRLEEGLSLAERAVEARPEEWRFRETYAAALASNNDLGGATREQKKAIELLSEDSALNHYQREDRRKELTDQLHEYEAQATPG